MLQAGLSKIDITPPVGTWLIGPEVDSTGVHDPLMATVLVLELANERHALISLDLCGLAEEESRFIRAAVGQACGATPERVTLMLSHTHSAPFSIPWSAEGWRHYREHEQDWATALPKLIAQAAREAASNLSEAQLGYARASVQIGQNRRSGGYAPGTEAEMQPDPAGSVTPWSDVLTISAPDGTLRAVLYSQAAHPVMIHKASTLISADYPYYANRRLRERLGNDVTPMFAQSCGADNNAPWATGFEVCERAGTQLGDAVAEACARAVPITTPERIVSETHVFDLPLKPLPSEAELERAIAEQERKLSQMAGPLTVSASDQPIVLREQLRLLREGCASKSMPMEVQVLAFGRQFAVVALANEVFSGYQLAIDKFSPFEHTAVLAYCNQTENYITTDAEQARGGYEVVGGPRYYPYRSGPQVGAEPLILSQVAEMLQRAYTA